MIPQLEKVRFWYVVERCLEQFHALTPAASRQHCDQYRAVLDGAPSTVDTDLIYHADPFQVACDLNDKQLNVDQLRTEYDGLLEQIGW